MAEAKATYSPPPGMKTQDFVYIAFEIVVGFISVCSNSVVLAVICKTSRLHTVTNVFMGNLALADVMVGISVAPCATLSYVGLPLNYYGCMLINSIILMVTNVSILMLLAIAIERFIAIKEPYLYERIMTINRAVIVNIFVWLLGLSLGMVPLFGWNTGYRELEYCAFRHVFTKKYLVYFQFFGLVLFPMSIMLVVYVYIIIIVRRHVRKSNALSEQFQGKQVNDAFSREVKSARWLAMVIVLFGVLWLPINIMNCLMLFCPQCQYSLSLVLVAIVMSHANSCINPFLYAASNSRIKRAIKEMLGLRRPYERHLSDAQFLQRSIEGNTSRNTDVSSTLSPGTRRPSSGETLTAPRKLSVAKKVSVDSSGAPVRRKSRVMRLLSCTGPVSDVSENVKDTNPKPREAEEAAAENHHKSDVDTV